MSPEINRRKDGTPPTQSFQEENALPLDGLQRIDKVCMAFEDVWKAGESPQIEQFLGDTIEPERSQLLKELLRLELEYLQQRGEALSLEQYQARFPEHPRQIAIVFQEYLARIANGYPSGAKIRYFGDYEILEEIAQGGMGIVYKARQLSLNRVVALKMIRSGQLATAEEIERFHREAEAAANLQHPNIVAIHEVGEYEGRHYYSMDFVEGQSLRAMIGGNPQPARQSAQYLKTIAEAIDYAHKRGVLHRDLKPANILIDCSNQPRISDFGLAKRMETDSTLTHTQETMGTPSYMPPEQAQGRWTEVGPASDVYSLGAILYELLTGRPPFRGETPTDTLSQVLHNEPIALKSLNPKTPRDLETICLKCLEKEPQHRYPSANLLVEELNRYLSGKPIIARPISRLARSWRWCRRQPVLASLTAALVLSIVILVIGSTMASIVLYHQLRRAETSEAKAMDRLWGSYLAQTRAGSVSNLIGQRFESLDAVSKAAAIRPTQELRDEAVTCMQLFDLRLLRQWELSPKPLSNLSVVFDQTLDHFAYCSEKGSLTVRRTSDNFELFHTPSDPKALGSELQLSPDGQLLAAKHHQDDILRIWDVVNGKLLFELPIKVYKAAFAFSPDGRRFAAGSSDGTIVVYNVATLEELQRLKALLLPTNLEFHPRENRLAVLSDEGSVVEVHDLDWSVKPWHLQHPHLVRTLQWSPDGSLLAVACNDQIHLWDADTLNQLNVLQGHHSKVTRLVFNRTGNILASFGWDCMARFWDPYLNKELLHVVSPTPVNFTPDNRQLVFNDEKSMGVWEIADRESRQLYRRPSNKTRFYDFDFSPDGRIVTCATSDGVWLWDSALCQQLAFLPQDPTAAALFTPDGRGLITSSCTQVCYWPLTADAKPDCLRLGPPERLCTSHGNGDKRAAITPDGRWLAAITGFDRITVLDLKQPEKTVVLSTRPPATFVTISPDGRWVADGAWGNVSGIRIWDAMRGKLVHRLFPDQGGIAAVFSPDGKWLVMEKGDEYQFWDTATWEPGRRIPRVNPGVPGQIAFSADTHMMAIAPKLYQLQLIDPVSGRELTKLPSSTLGFLSCSRFSRDGGYLVVANNNHPELWDIRRVRERLKALELDWDLPSLPERSPAAPIRALTVLYSKNDISLEASGSDNKMTWHDVLSHADLEKDRVTGMWDLNQAKATTNGKEFHSRLMLPVRVEGGYDLSLKFTRLRGEESVNIGLPVGSTRVGLAFSGWTVRGSAHGLELVDGKLGDANATTVRPGTLTNGQGYDVLVSVRVKGEEASIEVLLEGKLCIRWKGKQSSLSYLGPFGSPDIQRPSLGACRDPVRFEEVKVRAVSGSVSFVR